MKSQPDLLKTDASERQQAALDYILSAQKNPTAPVPRISVKEARQGAAQVEVISERETTRLLFISRDTSLLNQTQQSLDGYLNLSDVFDEVHIVILQTGLPARNPVLRVAPNVWLYIATATHWWSTPFSAMRLLHDQMEFATGFRPDLIVARDAYECGVVALWASHRYERPCQLHVLEDFTDQRFATFAPENKWRRRLARFVIRRFFSVRTATDQLTALIQKLYPAIPDVATLPRLHNYSAITAAQPLLTIKDKYRQFSFIILWVGELYESSTVYQAMDAVRALLQNPRVGCVVIGDGPRRTEALKRAKILGIEQQVVFERSVDDMVGYLKSADVLLVTDTDAAADEMALMGAAAGIPLVLTHTPLRDDLFAHGESALLSNLDAGADTILNLRTYLNDVLYRQQMAVGAQQMIATRLHDDTSVYQYAYRESVESALFTLEEVTPQSVESESEPV